MKYYFCGKLKMMFMSKYENVDIQIILSNFWKTHEKLQEGTSLCLARLLILRPVQFSSVAQSCPTLCELMDFSMPGWLPCPSPTPRACSDSCPSSWWCHPTILYSTVPFSSHFQPFPGSGSFQMSQLFESGGQSIGVSASAAVLPMNSQYWFPLGWTGWISLICFHSS